MSWRLRQKLRKAPPGANLIAEKLDEFESRMREANAAPRGEAMNHELTWPVHRLHYEKNRYLYDMRYKHDAISDALLKHLVREKIADGALIAKWKTPGYNTLCSLSVITRSNTNFGTVGICRTPLHERAGQITPNVQTGCVCCVAGTGGPIWWNDPVPDVVRERILEIDPGKAPLLEGNEDGSGGSEPVSDAETREDETSGAPVPVDDEESEPPTKRRRSNSQETDGPQNTEHLSSEDVDVHAGESSSSAKDAGFVQSLASKEAVPDAEEDVDVGQKIPLEDVTSGGHAEGR